MYTGTGRMKKADLLFFVLFFKYKYLDSKRHLQDTVNK